MGLDMMKIGGSAVDAQERGRVIFAPHFLARVVASRPHVVHGEGFRGSRISVERSRMANSTPGLFRKEDLLTPTARLAQAVLRVRTARELMGIRIGGQGI